MSLTTPSTTANTTQVITSAILPQTLAFQFPGAKDEPGHREIEVEDHLGGGADSGASGIPYVAYNFQDIYGTDPQGNTLHNAITEAQKERAREIFQFYSEISGLDFRETASSGLTIVTGDLRALDPNIPTGAGGVAGLAGGSLAIMDMAESWNNLPGGSWFDVAMHEIGHLLGLGHTYDLPAGTVMGSGPDGSSGVGIEPDFPGDHDITHMQHLFRPDSIDIDLYRFQVNTTSIVSAEVMAERLANSSPLDSVLRLYREVNGVRELIAQNDNYFSKDSFLELTLEPGVYFIGVSSTGNDAYDPTIANTGIGGTSQGTYDLRLNFRPNTSSPGTTIVDTTGKMFDGDADGIQGGVYNFWFKTATAANTLFVDKSNASFLSSPVTASTLTIFVRRVEPFAVNDVIRIGNEQMRIAAINPLTRAMTVARGVNATTATTHSINAPVRKISSNGQIVTPFGFITDAMAAAQPGQVVRIVGNGGADSDIATVADNLSYEIGLNNSNAALPDGSSLEVPRGVTLMIDPGAIVKLRQSWIGVGSSTTSVDRSGGTLQVIGVPGRRVIFTSWNDETIGGDTTSTPTTAAQGDWGGIIFRNQIDRDQNRYNSENDGIFANYVGYADIRYGGGDVTIDTSTQTINPIHIDRSQPTVTNNLVQFSKSSAMSADPDSFEELTFHSPRFQTGKPAFAVDYKRIGPDIRGNTLLGNGNNGLFVRIDTLAGNATEKMTIPGRFDDTDIVHIISQNLEIQGTPGGAYTDDLSPSVQLTTLTTVAGGTLATGTYNYRVVFTDENGFESPASTVTGNLTLAATGSIRLAQLPPATGVYTGRRIYRSSNTGGGTYTLVAELDKTATSFTDTGVNLTRTLVAAATRDRARLDARLSIDPGIVVKLQGARIITGFGAQLIAEGASGRQVTFTSRLDDRFGAGGTFDTNNDDAQGAAETTPSEGNWSGMYIGHLGSVSIDRALITFGGGNAPVGGGTFAGGNTIEIHQAKARIRNTVFERNEDGTAGGARDGLFTNAPGTIFVRGAQPVILDNVFNNNDGAVININANSLNKDYVVDPGRSTGRADQQLSYRDNQGALIRDNIFDSNELNGMVVRGEVLTTEGVWDDTDIVHIVTSEIYIPNMHTFGGLRLESSSTESLVIKLAGTTAGFTAGGNTLDITDRIGGMLHVIGQPGQPVIMTALSDDNVGAGFNLRGLLQKDTNGNGNSSGTAGQWRGLKIEKYSHDRNVAVYVENEIADRFSADSNSTAGSAETIGSLAEREGWSDENLRLGVDLEGVIDSPSDVDVYSFSGVAGSQVWLDIDRTTFALDSVVELLDSTGTVLAQSDSYLSEKLGLFSVIANQSSSVQAFGLDYSPFLSDDHFSINQNDPGLRVVLPGTAGVRGTYFVRVRSSNIDSTTAAPRADLQDNSKVPNGLTSGGYNLQIRLQEEDEFAGTTIQFADIRFAETGIAVEGQPTHSPLVGESAENETGNTPAAAGALPNLMDYERGALAVRGSITGTSDVDFFNFEVNYVGTQQIAGVSLTAPHVPVVFDIDYADGLARADLAMAVFDSTGRLILFGQDSNVAEDQAGPLEGTDLDDLTRGSVGTFDPFIGGVELPGGRYSVAVFNKRRVPATLNQFFAASTNAPLARVEPINSVKRIFEERFTAGDNDTFTSATQPSTQLFNVAANGALDPKHVVDYHLGDVVLFVALNAGLKGSDETTIATLNPFTGEVVTALGSIGQSTGDIAMRPDGQLYTFSTGAGNGSPSTSDNSANTGNYLRLDTGTAAATNIGDDGITANLDNLNAGDDTTVAHAGAGIRYSAMTYIGTGDNDLFAVGQRFDQADFDPAQNNIAYAYRNTANQNILYQFNITTGAVVGNGPNRGAPGSGAATQGAGTTQREIGRIAANGNVTGMARVNGQTFVVDDLGFLYSLNLGNAAVTQIANLGVSFTSLAAGPDEVENGAYADILFGMSSTGDLLAFDTTGILTPVFFDGQSTISTGLPAVPGLVNGIAFSTLDRNLWATTTNRGADLGHGVEPRFDDSVLANREQGSRSLYFGNQRSGANAGNQNNLSTTAINNVNFPGGAHGTVVSNEFSLQGYDRTDKPMLYFNYFLETEGAAMDPTTNAATLMRDSFRVFVGDESGNWNLVSTNDSYQHPVFNDEYDYGPDGSATTTPQAQTFPDVVETFDNTQQWRQARIDLSNYAGRGNLRLRFDFSTAASMNLGDTFTTGSELRALPGEKLRDGNTFTIDGVVFEFDMGSTLVTPSGAAANGQSFTVGGQTFTYSLAAGGANTIQILATDSAASVATKTAAAINAVLGANSALLPAGSNRVNTPGQSITGAGANLTVDGAAGITGNRAVVVTPLMTASEVATVMRQSIADEYSAGDITNVKGHEELVWVIGHDVDNAGPLGFSDFLPGDEFGAFSASFQNGVGNRPGSQRGMNNAVEGVYVDDIILGFAERGEMVVNAPSDMNFADNRDITNTNLPAANTYQGIDSGPYDLEIRRTSDYAETQDAPPTNGLLRDLDTNDREAQTTSITLPSAANLADGSQITISDGINSVVFEFRDVRSSAPVTPGNFLIPFNTALGAAGDRDAELANSLAAKLRDAINSTTVQNLLKIKASLSDGTETGTASTSSQLHLTGNAIVTLDAQMQLSATVTVYNFYGDQNHFRDQGQLIIQSSTISNARDFAIESTAAPKTPLPSGFGVTPPAPGSVRNLHTINTAGLATSLVIMNNVMARNGQGGILFSGDVPPFPVGVVPYGRIINNTIVGLGTNTGTGIVVQQNASPTILNNIVADFATGISVDNSSRTAGTVYNYTLYRGNGTNNNGALDTFAIVLSNTDPLFVDQANGNYYPAPLSKAIDSSVTSVSDRSAILAVKSPLDLDGRDNAGSPVLAPIFDVYGQLRGNDPDVETPGSQGASVNFDRGAIDRVDFFRPQAELANPEDQSLIDGDPDVDEVWIDQVQILRQFRVRLVDVGIGIDNATVNKSQFILKRVETDGVTETVLVEGQDYEFVYNEITREAIFNAATFFADQNTEARYIILIDNDGTSPGDTVNGVRDLAGNYLLTNKGDGTTRFDIVLTDGVNDPPVNNVPPQQQTPEDTNLVFSTANGNAISIFDQDAHLGSNILTVTLTAANGVLSLGSIPSGLSFLNGTMDGILDLTMTFTGKLQDINTALAGLQFVPDQDYFTQLPTYGFGTVTITTNDLGEFSGPAQSDTDVINIDITPVNDAPTFNQPSDVPLLETAAEAVGGVVIPGFLTGQSAGPANETPPQTVSAILTPLSVTNILGGASPWTAANFFDSSVPLSVNTTTGDLSFKTNANVNGIVTVQIVLQDSLNALSLPRTFRILVTPVNDAPVYTTNTVTDAPGNDGVGNLAIDGVGNITIDEDAGRSLTVPVTIDFINQFAPAAATALDEINLPQTTTWSVSSPVNSPGALGGNLVFTRFEVDTLGNITFQTAQDTAGQATFTLTLQDDGGTLNGGINLLSRTFTINVRQINDAPVAISADNYTVDEGSSVVLDASASYDPDAFFGDSLTFRWDFNNDGIYDTAASGLPLRTVTWNELAAVGITAPGVYTIALRATDQSGATNVDTATLTTLIVDYGDAPNTYGTLKASVGAAHTINGTLFLGSSVDKEQDGQPNSTATGDGADEDGVVFLTSFEADPTRNLPAYVDVTSSGAGKVDMWLDLNRNGQFDHATEHLGGGISFNVTPGTNRLFFTIPAGTSVGSSMLRVRLSSAGLLQPTGRANDGEVEDYSVQIKALQAPTTPTFTRPFDFNLADGRIPQTSDLTPAVAWIPREENYYYDLVVRNASNVVVFTQTATTQTSFDMPVLSAGTYTATLTAYNKANTAAAPAVYQFQVVPVAVSSPIGDVQTYRPTINWNHVEGTKTYSVELESLTTGQQFLFTVDATTASPPNRLVLANDLAIGQYRVRVRATDMVDVQGDWSPFANFTVRTPVTITAPTGSVTSPRPQVTWNAVPGAVRYSVTLFNVTDNVTAATVSNILTNNWTPTSDLSLAEYRVTVVAFNSAGDTTVPNAPYSFTVAPIPVVVTPIGAIADSTPTFSWNALTGADRYELVVSRAYGDLGVVFTEANLTGTQYTRSTPLPLGRYTFRVRGVNDPSGAGPVAVPSSFSATTSFTVTERVTVTSPDSTTFQSRPVITWTAPVGSSSTMVNSQVWINKIERNAQGQPFQRNIVDESGIAGNSFTVNQDLVLGTYVVWVRTYSTVDPAVVSEWSIAKTFRVTTIPTLIGVKGRTADATPTLTWQGVPGGQTYRVFISSLSTNVVVYNVGNLNALNYTPPSNLPMGRYRYWVQATSAFGDVSAWSLGMDFQVVASPALSGPSSSTFNTKPSFNWTAVAGAETYEFRMDRVLATSVVENYINVTGLTQTGYNVPTDLPTGLYRAFVRARRSDTQGDYSFALQFFVGGRPIVNAIGTTTNTTPTFRWGAVDGASGYEILIQKAVLAPGEGPIVRQNNLGTTSFTLPSALGKGTYRVWVRAINAATGTFSLWSEGASTTFTIADASEAAQSTQMSDFVLTTMPLSSLESSSESAISMLPAVISGSEYQAVVSDAFQPSEMKPVVQLLQPIEPEKIVDADATQDADEILSNWDQQLWWDESETEMPAVAPEAPVASAQTTTTASTSDTRAGAVGFFGALLALAPKSLRRRREKEERLEE